MDNLRLQQLIFMFAQITNMSTKESEAIILETDTGKSVQNGNPTVMYEQQTENLYCIASELHRMEKYDNLADAFTLETIVDAMQKLSLDSPLFSIIESNSKGTILKPEIKEDHLHQNKERMKHMLQIKRQNQLNAWRVDNADKSKR